MRKEGERRAWREGQRRTEGGEGGRKKEEEEEKMREGERGGREEEERGRKSNVERVERGSGR